MKTHLMIILTVCIVIVSLYLSAIFVTVVTISGNVGCGGDSPTPMEDYTATEWGIFKQRYGYANISSLGGRLPHEVLYPDVVASADCKPVIYFHGDGQTELEIEIEYDGTEILTIPEADVNDAGLHWDVRIAGELYDEKSNAAVVAKDDTAYEYLFYEGIREYTQNVYVNITRTGGTYEFVLSNLGSFRAENLHLLVEEASKNSSSFGTMSITELGRNTTINITMENLPPTGPDRMKTELRAQLEARGLTKGETGELLRYWIDGETDENGIRTDRTLLQPLGYPNARLLYFITEEEYDHMLPIEFSRAPSEFNRVGIMFVSDIFIE